MKSSLMNLRCFILAILSPMQFGPSVAMEKEPDFGGEPDIDGKLDLLKLKGETINYNVAPPLSN